jgi:hypothetical protein
LIRYSRIACIQSWSWKSLSPDFAHCCFREWNVAIAIRWPNPRLYCIYAALF